MDIILLEPIYKNYIWGGQKLKTVFKKNTPFEKTAESWEVSANENGMSKIKNEEYKGRTLKNLFEDKKIKDEIFGRKLKKVQEFPILIKLIDARDNLSIQVHPNDEYAKKIGMKNGKTEMWYIIECEDNGKIIGGLNKKMNKKDLKKIIENNNIKNYLNYIDIKKGDSIYIPAGTIHAILKNTLICEIQQNSDITYRVYDWDRKDKDGKERTLHKKEAFETIDINSIPQISHTEDKAKCKKIAENEFFCVERINVENEYEDCSDINTFYAINILSGKGILKVENKEYKLECGDSFLIPATLGKYKIKGNMKFLKTYIK